MATATTSSYPIHLRQRITQSFLLIWVDSGIDKSNEDCQNTLTQLRNIVNDVNVFNQRDECIDFLTDVENMKTFMIIDGALSQKILPLIHDIPQLDSIYILCRNKSKHEEWTKAWMKVKGTHTQISSICESLLQAVKQVSHNSIAVSFIAANEADPSQNLNQLEPTFMYTQIFKEIILEMDHNKQSIKDFVAYCRNGDLISPTVIARFENEYNTNSSIWWYTYPSCIYSLLNTALRMLEGETIINMGFFIRDLHHQVKGLHKKQAGSYHRKPFIVYRGQGLVITDFEKLRKTKGGLLSFNNFLSTSEKEELSLDFAKIAATNTDMVGILFRMSINPAVSSAPYAAIREVSYFNAEEEILFSMHTVFRIGEIKQIDCDNLLYQVELELTTDDDPQLHILTERIREELARGTEWGRLSDLLWRIGESGKAEELCNVLLLQTPDESEKATYYNNLGSVKDNQGDYEKALQYHKKALEIRQKTFPPNHLSMATSYNNIASVYDNMGEYSKALSFYEKALGIRQKTLPPNHPSLATSYNNIASVYRRMEEYSKALSFHEKALEIQQKTLPPNHPDMATSYNNIASVYHDMGEYSKALSFYEKALEIQHKTLLPNHPDLATSYNNIASVYHDMGEYSKALSFYEKALEIQHKTLLPNHPDLATSYNNVASVYHRMEEYSKALSFHEKALGIRQKTLPPNHPDLATSYNNIASVYGNMGEYSKALSFYEKALGIRQKTLPPNHPSLAASYNNIASMYDNMEEYSKALSFYEKALGIEQKTLPPNHSSLATSYNNIGVLYYKKREHSKAVLFFGQALDIFKSSLPSNHPSIISVQGNIEFIKKNL